LPGLIAARVLLKKLRPPAPVGRPFIIRRNQNTSAIGKSNRRCTSSINRFSSSTTTRSKQVASPSSSNDESATNEIDSTNLRLGGLSPKIAEKLVADPDDLGWIPIYRFRWIHFAAATSKLKILQTIFVVIVVPVYYFYQQNKSAVSKGDMQFVIGVALFALVMLYIMTAVFRRCIGVISVNEDRARIRIGYLSFWGGRRNVVIPVDDVMPLDEANGSLGSRKRPPAYVKVKRYTDTKFYLYLPLLKITVVDPILFEDVFGPIGLKKD